MNEFNISAKWIDQEGRTEADATLCNLLIEVAGKNVSAFVDRRERVSERLQIPGYYLAEWIADNWWPLLWEPRKGEEGDDNDFLGRHSFLSAQHGYALPKVLIVAFGTTIEIEASPRDVTLGDVRFAQRAQASCPRDLVEGQLRKYIQFVVDRLEEKRVTGTWLQDTWALISDTGAETEQFCRFAGALGLSPYDIDETTANMLERLQPLLGDRSLMDLCLAASPDRFASVAAVAEKAHAIVRGAPTSTLSPIASLKPPKENHATPAYRRGVHGAHMLRKRLGIEDKDIRGATKIFELFEIDTTKQSLLPRNATSDESAITGAVLRNEDVMRIGLLQEQETKRRFSGARAIFSAWTSDESAEPHLLTSAVTREQQANRAFAAELTAPQAVVKAYARNGRLSLASLFDLAAEARISPDVVSKRASDIGIRVPPI